MTTLEQTRERADRDEAGLCAFRRYIALHDTTWVTKHAKVDDFPLGAWLTETRHLDRCGRAPASLVAQLDAEFGDWRKNPRARFADGMTATRAWLIRHGTSSAPPEAVINGFPVGSWQVRQRTEQRAGRLPATQIAQIEAAFDDWVWPEPSGIRTFDEAVEIAADYTATQGHSDIPRRTVHQDFSLGEWAHKQRRLYARGALPASRIAALNRIRGWEWTNETARRRRAIAALRQYRNQHGPNRIPTRNAVVADFKLGSWCHSRRKEQLAGRLDETIAAELRTQFPVVWAWMTQPDADFRRTQILTAIGAYSAITGDPVIPADAEFDGHWIGSWCRDRRAEYLAGTLNPSTRELLAQSLPDVWKWMTRPRRNLAGSGDQLAA